MQSEVTTAVILAAGLGSRLKERTAHVPKGFIEVEGKAIIERSIDILISHGISKIIIGTGYHHEQFDVLKQKYPLETLRNSDYRTTGSMYTLYVLRHLIKSPFLLLESDLLFEPASLKYLLEDARPDLILTSGKTNSGDEVYIEATSNGELRMMSKDARQLGHITGELVGISKLSPAALQKMVAYAEAQFSIDNKMINYEDALVGISGAHPLYIKLVESLIWCEIDDENHLNRALNEIFPQIKKVMAV